MMKMIIVVMMIVQMMMDLIVLTDDHDDDLDNYCQFTLYQSFAISIFHHIYNGSETPTTPVGHQTLTSLCSK